MASTLKYKRVPTLRFDLPLCQWLCTLLNSISYAVFLSRGCSRIAPLASKQAIYEPISQTKTFRTFSPVQVMVLQVHSLNSEVNPMKPYSASKWEI